MRAIWVDEGNDADYAKLAANGITEPCYALRDPRVTGQYLRNVQARGLDPGVYVVKSWYPADTPAAFATRVSKMLERLRVDSTPDFPFVCIDYEPTNVPDILACLRQWRKHRPGRVTDLTIEGHQGGLFRPSDVIAVVAQTRYTVPQCYNAAMTQLWDTFAMAHDLTDHSWPIDKVRPFYDAAHLPEWWDGYAFTQGRLP